MDNFFYLRKVYVSRLSPTACKMVDWLLAFVLFAKHKDHEKGNLSMPDKRLQPISAFGWASVAQYTVYISGVAGLLEVNSDHVSCLPLAKVGPTKLLARKLRMATILRSNLKGLEVFVEKHKDDLGLNEMSVIRGFYRQYKENLETVEGHMEIIENYAQSLSKDMFQQSEEIDDTPF